MNSPQKMILVIEDDDGNRQLLRELLSFQNYHVIEASSGHGALALLEDHTIDLILMDVSLPDMSGLTVTKQIRKKPRFSRVPIIVLTAYVRKSDQEAALAAGASSHIPKPVNIQYLLSEIQKHLTLSAD